jgi:predicted metal-dependent enzyme (double-stranded beta helix superfamily)
MANAEDKYGADADKGIEGAHVKKQRARLHRKPASNQRVDEDRDGFHHDIARVFEADHASSMAILEEKKPGWEKAFIAQRSATMRKAAELMPAMFEKYPHLVSDEECAPRANGTYKERDFRVVILNADKELGFFTVALIFDPGQSTSPHTHKTLCYGVPYRGETEETVFDEQGRVVHSVLRSKPHEIEVASPDGDGDLHAVGNPKQPKHEPSRDDVSIQIHMYDGHDLQALLENGEIKPMILGNPGEKLSGARQSYEITGYPSPITGTRYSGKTDISLPDRKSTYHKDAVLKPQAPDDQPMISL